MTEPTAPTPLPISAYIRTKNEARLIADVVRAALQVADEVIVVDSGSTDDTIALARAAGATVHEREWEGVGKQKRIAEDLCQHPWRLDLDGDEVISPELAAEIRALFAAGEPPHAIYTLRMIWAPPIGKPWVHSNYDPRNKLYDARRIRMPDHAAWDQLDIPEGMTLGKLKAPIIHYAFTDLGFMTRKLERNMTQRAKSAPLKQLWQLRLRVIFGMPVYFLKRYLVQGLWREGLYGFAFSVTIAYGRWLKDVKMYERHQMGLKDD